MNTNIAQNLITIAKNEAEKANVSVCITVLDAGAHLVAFIRTDNAPIGTIEVSQKKARTAALFQTDSKNLGAGVGQGGPSYTFEHTNGGLIVFGGGVALFNKTGTFMGAIGVAGATIEIDEAIARTAANSLLI